MMLRKSELQKILVTGVGGFVAACFVGLCNNLIEKKLVVQIDAPSEHIAQNDHFLLTLLSHLQNKEEVNHEDFLRLVATCEELLKVECLKQDSERKIASGLIFLNRAKQIMKGFPPECLDLCQAIQKQLTKHYENVVMGSKS